MLPGLVYVPKYANWFAVSMTAELRGGSPVIDGRTSWKVVRLSFTMLADGVSAVPKYATWLEKSRTAELT